ncbi:hypothetical protein ACJJTC_002906 [Scirpophaga incertulas]
MVSDAFGRQISAARSEGQWCGRAAAATRVLEQLERGAALKRLARHHHAARHHAQDGELMDEKASRLTASIKAITVEVKADPSWEGASPAMLEMVEVTGGTSGLREALLARAVPQRRRRHRAGPGAQRPHPAAGGVHERGARGRAGATRVGGALSARAGRAAPPARRQGAARQGQCGRGTCGRRPIRARRPCCATCPPPGRRATRSVRARHVWAAPYPRAQAVLRHLPAARAPRDKVSAGAARVGGALPARAGRAAPPARRQGAARQGQCGRGTCGRRPIRARRPCCATCPPPGRRATRSVRARHVWAAPYPRAQAVLRHLPAARAPRDKVSAGAARVGGALSARAGRAAPRVGGALAARAGRAAPRVGGALAARAGRAAPPARRQGAARQGQCGRGTCGRRPIRARRPCCATCPPPGRRATRSVRARHVWAAPYPRAQSVLRHLPAARAPRDKVSAGAARVGGALSARAGRAAPRVGGALSARAGRAAPPARRQGAARLGQCGRGTCGRRPIRARPCCATCGRRPSRARRPCCATCPPPGRRATRSVRARHVWAAPYPRAQSVLRHLPAARAPRDKVSAGAARVGGALSARAGRAAPPARRQGAARQGQCGRGTCGRRPIRARRPCCATCGRRPIRARRPCCATCPPPGRRATRSVRARHVVGGAPIRARRPCCATCGRRPKPRAQAVLRHLPAARAPRDKVSAGAARVGGALSARAGRAAPRVGGALAARAGRAAPPARRQGAARQGQCGRGTCGRRPIRARSPCCATCPPPGRRATRSVRARHVWAGAYPRAQAVLRHVWAAPYPRAQAVLRHLPAARAPARQGQCGRGTCGRRPIRARRPCCATCGGALSARAGRAAPPARRQGAARQGQCGRGTCGRRPIRARRPCCATCGRRPSRARRPCCATCPAARAPRDKVSAGAARVGGALSARAGRAAPRVGGALAARAGPCCATCPPPGRPRQGQCGRGTWWAAPYPHAQAVLRHVWCIVRCVTAIMAVLGLTEGEAPAADDLTPCSSTSSSSSAPPWPTSRPWSTRPRTTPSAARSVCANHLRAGEPGVAAVHHRAGERAGRRGAAGRGAVLVDAVLRRRGLHQDHGVRARARLLAPRGHSAPPWPTSRPWSTRPRTTPSAARSVCANHLRAGEPGVAAVHHRAGERAGRRGAAGRGAVLVDAVLRRRGLHQDHGVRARARLLAPRGHSAPPWPTSRPWSTRPRTTPSAARSVCANHLRAGEPGVAAVHHRAGERAGRRGAAGRGAVLVDAVLRRRGLHQDHGVRARARLLAPRGHSAPPWPTSRPWSTRPRTTPSAARSVCANHLRAGEPGVAAVHHRAGERAGRRGAAGRGAVLVDAVLRRRGLHQDHGVRARARLLAPRGHSAPPWPTSRPWSTRPRTTPSAARSVCANHLRAGEPGVAAVHHRAGERAGRRGAAGRGAVLVDAVLRRRGLHQDHGVRARARLLAPREQVNPASLLSTIELVNALRGAGAAGRGACTGGRSSAPPWPTSRPWSTRPRTTPSAARSVCANHLRAGEPGVAAVHHRAGERAGRRGAAGRGAVLVDAVLRRRGLHQDHGVRARARLLAPRVLRRRGLHQDHGVRAPRTTPSAARSVCANHLRAGEPGVAAVHHRAGERAGRRGAAGRGAVLVDAVLRRRGLHQDHGVRARARLLAPRGSVCANHLRAGEPGVAAVHHRAGERAGRRGAAGRGAVLVDAVLRRRGLHQDHGVRARARLLAPRGQFVQRVSATYNWNQTPDAQRSASGVTPCEIYMGTDPSNHACTDALTRRG